MSLSVPHYQLREDATGVWVTIAYPDGNASSFKLYGAKLDEAEARAREACRVTPGSDAYARAIGWAPGVERGADEQPPTTDAGAAVLGWTAITHSIPETPSAQAHDGFDHMPNPDTSSMLAERRRYYAAVPGFDGDVPGDLWQRLSRGERHTFLNGTLPEVRALAARLGVKPLPAKATRTRSQQPHDAVTAAACTIARTGDQGALAKFLGAVAPRPSSPAPGEHPELDRVFGRRQPPPRVEHRGNQMIFATGALCSGRGDQ